MEGEAVSLVCIDEKKLLADIEKLLKCRIESVVIPGYEPDASIRAVPIKNGGNGSRGRNSRPNNRGRNNPGQARNNRSRNASAQANRGRGQGQRSRRAA
jgi:ATP-dependent RNA helicase RhlE